MHYHMRLCLTLLFKVWRHRGIENGCDLYEEQHPIHDLIQELIQVLYSTNPLGQQAYRLLVYDVMISTRTSQIFSFHMHKRWQVGNLVLSKNINSELKSLKNAICIVYKNLT